jgi:stress response protein YsnF
MGASMDTARFQAMTDEQLRAYGRDAGVRGADSLDRDQLIAAVTGSDEAMTRSEERLVATTDVVEIGRARLRKYVVTEEVQITVAVRREELRLEREAVPPAQQSLVHDPDIFGPAEVFGGPDGGVVFEITLHEERPVVMTEIVPVERVRLNKLVRTDTEVITGPVRKEVIEADIPGQDTTTFG